MQRMMLIGGATALALAGGSAIAAESCQSRLQALLAEAPDLGRMQPGEQVLAKRTLRNLRSAAIRLQQDGYENACNVTLDALAKAETEYQLMIMHPSAPGTVKGKANQASPQPSGPVVQQDRLVPLGAAKGSFDTGQLRGNPVYDSKGEAIGEFAGFLTGAGGAATHMLIAHGKFWNISDQEAAVPVGIVKWDPQAKTFYVPLTKQQLGDAPDYGNDWQAQANDSYYAGLHG